MDKSRGKKSKKSGWHLTLGLREIIFAGLGVAALMMMSFVLGALAGRGDIYRAASSLGLMSPEAPKMAQWIPPGEGSGLPATASAPAAPATATTPEASLPAPVASVPAPAAAPLPQAPPAPQAHVPVPAVAAKPAKPAPVAASLTPLSPPVSGAATAKKKTKTGTIHKDPKAGEEELRRVRQEVVQKLKFQNSFDTAPKARLPKSKEHDKAQAKSVKSPTPPVRVAEYRTSKEAQAKAAELQKQGLKASIRKSKDAKGGLYIVYKSGSAAPADANQLAKKAKNTGATKKPTE